MPWVTHEEVKGCACEDGDCGFCGVCVGFGIRDLGSTVSAAEEMDEFTVAVTNEPQSQWMKQHRCVT